MKLLVVAGLLVSGAPLSGQDPAGNGESWRLLQGLGRCRRIEIQTPAGKPARAMLKLARCIGEQGIFTTNLRAADEKGAPDAVRILAGASSDPGLLQLARHCGVAPLEGGGFRFLEREFRGPGDALVGTFEDPERSARPLCLFLGNDPQLLALYLTEIPALTRPFLRVFADGDIALACPLDPSGAPRASEVIDYQERRRSYFAEASRQELLGISAIGRGDPDRDLWLDYAAGLTAARGRVLGWLSVQEAPVVELWIYDHPADLERCLGEDALVIENPLRPRVHVLLARGRPHDGGMGLARVLARSIAGEPANPWLLDGLAVAAAGRWWGRPIEAWLGPLGAGGLVPSLTEIVDERARERMSEHILLPARAFLLRVMLETSEADKLPSLWGGKGFRPAVVTPTFRSALRVLEKNAPRQKDKSRQSAKALAGPFRNGIVLADGAGELSSVYLSTRIGESLDQARAHKPGPDALSLLVFASTEAQVAPLATLRPSAVHGSASDLALANAAAEARARHMRLELALEPLAWPGGSWADGLVLTGLPEQREFWERYGRVALHYALLSELLGVEVYSLGANLRSAARTEAHKDVADERLVEALRDGWKRLIAQVRGAFTGALTYSATALDAKDIGFWDRLDAIGLFLYPRSAQTDRPPDDEELRGLLRFEILEALELGLHWDRPILLVQTGFPSRRDAWERPTFPLGPLDLEAQRRFYASLADVLEGGLVNGAMLRGIYLWNWLIEPPADALEDGGYTPQGKPAESVLPRLFSISR